MRQINHSQVNSHCLTTGFSNFSSFFEFKSKKTSRKLKMEKSCPLKKHRQYNNHNSNSNNSGYPIEIMANNNLFKRISAFSIKKTVAINIILLVSFFNKISLRMVEKKL